jgi:hypothetical protein
MFDRVAPILYRYEGTIARLLGDSLVAFFGTPVTHEDDAVRAVRAALEVMAVAESYAEEVKQRYAIDFQMRACLNTGPVVIGPVSSDLKYEFTAMGGAVNLASRLKFAGQPMQVLLTEYTHRLIAYAFECNDHGPVLVTGRREPVRMYSVVRPKSQPSQRRGIVGLRSPMIGRQLELDVLHHMSNAVCAGLGRAVLIVGEPGLGKSRLIREWQQAMLSNTPTASTASDAQRREDGERHSDSRPATWSIAQSHSYGNGIAYHLVINLLRALLCVPENAEEEETRIALQALTGSLSDSDNRLDAATPYIAHLMSLEMPAADRAGIDRLDPAALQYRYRAALETLLLVLTRRNPQIVVLEDIHWADSASIELLAQLVPLLRNAPLLLCMVARPEPASAGWQLVTEARSVLGSNMRELKLQALSVDESHLLVNNLLDINEVPDALRDPILAKAEGNPFFIEEVLRMLIDRNIIIRHNGSWRSGQLPEDLEIPDNLERLLLARIDRLPDDAKQTLRIASVIGRQFPLRVLARILGEVTQ